MLSFLADNLCMSGLRALEYLGRMAKVEMKLATANEFARMVLHGVSNRLSKKDMNRVCDMLVFSSLSLKVWIVSGSPRATPASCVVRIVNRLWLFCRSPISRRSIETLLVWNGFRLSASAQSLFSFLPLLE